MSDPATGDLKYRRVLLKLSGEAMAGEQGFGISPPVVDRLTEQVKAVQAMGVALGLVIGGGNIVRGTRASKEGMDRVSSDYMGCLPRSSTPWPCRTSCSARAWTPG